MSIQSDLANALVVMANHGHRLDDFYKLHANLNAIVNIVGGSGYTIQQLSNITALELLITLAPNRVRFTSTMAVSNE